MAKRTVEQVKADIDLNACLANGDIKRLSSLVSFGLDNEKIAFVLYAVEDDTTDANYIELLTEMYTGTEEGVVDLAWNMTGFDGTPEEQASMAPFIEAFANAHDGRYPNVSPNVLLAILTDPDNQAECKTMDEWLDVIEEAEPAEDEATPPPVDTKAAQEAQASAFAIGDELAKDTELQGLLGKTADTSQFLKIAPVLLMQRIEKHFPTTATGDPILGWPMPGSKHEKGLASEGNKLFDRYKIAAGTKKKIVSFYGLIFGRFPEGASIAKELAEIERGDDGRYAVSPTSGWTLAKRNAEKKTLETRFKDQTKYFGNAVKLHKQLAWLKTFPGCEVELDLDVDGSLRRTTTPFILTPKASGKLDYKYASPMTIGDVLRFDQDKAMTGIAGKPGGSWDALIETKKRVMSEEEAKAKLADARKIVDAAIKAGTMKADGTLAPTAQATEVGLIKSIPQLTSYVSMMAHFGRDMAEAEPDAPLVKDFTKAIATDDDLVMSWADLIKLADSIRPRIEVRRRQIEAKTIQANGVAKTA